MARDRHYETGKMHFVPFTRDDLEKFVLEQESRAPVETWVIAMAVYSLEAQGIVTTRKEATPQSPEYDLRAVRELLTAAFSDEGILTLAFDRFRTVYEDISSSGLTKTARIRRLVDWCDHNVQLEVLLAEVRDRNPDQYARFKGRLFPIR